MTTRIRCLIVALALIVPLVHSGPAAAAPQFQYPVIGRVVDGNGHVQRPSQLVACPLVGTTPDCAHRIVASTGPLGFAVLKLNKTVRYRLLAAVTNPNPAWVCPGLAFEGDVVYLSNESYDGLPSQLPQLATFTIVEPQPGDCAPITVTDQAGNPLPGAGVFINNDSGNNGRTDADGVLQIKVTTGATYEIRAYLPNSGWPCPSNTQPDGSTYHFSDTRTVTAEQLRTGTTTFVINHPAPENCVNVRVTDDAGNPVPNAGLFVDDGFSSPADAQGNIKLSITPGTSYQIGAFVGNTGWPCPQFTSPDGTTFHFAPTRTVTADELLTGTTTFVIVKPRPDDCAYVTITDDAGNPLPGAGVFINGSGGSGPANANGIVQISVTTGATYEIGAFLANSGWPCPAQTFSDGTTQHVSERRIVTTEQLLAGQTFVIHHPDASECAPRPTGAIRMFDEAGAPLPLAIISYCEHDPATPPSYPTDPATDCPRGNGFRGPDSDGVIRIPVTDPSSNIDITGFLSCTAGGFLFGDFNTRTPNGFTFWRISANDLLANGLDLKILGDTDTCLAAVAPA